MIALGTVAAAPQVGAETDIPAVDEIVHSDNLSLLANVPKQAPFDTLSSLDSDLAFQGRYAFAGNYGGFTVFDIHNPNKPRVVSQVSCPGPQNDVTVSGDLLFLSTDNAMTDDSCQATRSTARDANAWEGIKVFDISDKRNPQYVASVRTDCGSHTHTIIPRRDDVVIWVQSYNPNAAFPNCLPPHDKISIISVPRAHPEAAAVIATPVLFPDGGNPGDPGRLTSGCHDITVFPARNIAAGACLGDGVLFDITNPLAPRVIDRVQDNVNFAFWHSATFNNAGTKVVFTDELGGGSGPECNEAIGPNRGADGIYDIVGQGNDRRMVFRSYYKIPRMQADTENCVAHNGSLIPVRGRDIMVQAWYQGGISVWDFTDSSAPHEIAFFERGPLSVDQLTTGGAWSTYYYNGNIYSNDIQKGLDVLSLNDRRTNSARGVHFRELNVQTQPLF